VCTPRVVAGRAFAGGARGVGRIRSTEASARSVTVCPVLLSKATVRRSHRRLGCAPAEASDGDVTIGAATQLEIPPALSNEIQTCFPADALRRQV
jgi:hypothetical protein